MAKLSALIGLASFFSNRLEGTFDRSRYKILSCFHRVPDGTNTSDVGAAGSCECEMVTWLLPRSEVDNLDTDPASAQLLPKATLCELDNLGSDRDQSFPLRSTSRWEPQNRAR